MNEAQEKFKGTHLCPFSPPDRDRRVDSPALSARGSDLRSAPQDPTVLGPPTPHPPACPKPGEGITQARGPALKKDS